ncbi:F0F1 ATP synthase subunit gamma, partial [Salmonella sp. s55004]|uniref:F0F1 ATP synthase subunit gamma n=1 Tax=Salmonella sp. s55004 TaxID=3159675 RepID=UPI00397F595C
ATALYEKAEVATEESKENHLIIAASSDRGLCGGIHSNIAKAVRRSILDKGDDINVKVVVVGDKARTQLEKLHGKYIMLSVNEYGRKPPTFEDASKIATAVLESGFEFDTGEIIFNRFKSVVSYKTSIQPVVP